MRRYALAAAVLLLAAIPLLLRAQRGCNGCEALVAPPNPKYDGRFAYPRSDHHFPKIIQELTTVRTRTDETVILALDDPDLRKFPFAYWCEAGYWLPSEAYKLGVNHLVYAFSR